MNHFSAAAAVTQQGIEAAILKKKKKKKLSKVATPTLNAQSSFAMAKSEIDLAQIGDCEIGNSKSKMGNGKSEIRK